MTLVARFRGQLEVNQDFRPDYRMVGRCVVVNPACRAPAPLSPARSATAAGFTGAYLLSDAQRSRLRHGYAVLRNPKARMGVFLELLRFLGERKKYWLASVILVSLIQGALLVFAQGSVLAPFIYSLF